MTAAAQNKTSFWHSNWGRALYFTVAIAFSIAYFTLLLFLVSNSIIDRNAFYLGSNIFLIPYLILLFLSPSKNKKESDTFHKVLPYMLLDGAVCFALLLLAYFSVSNSIIAVQDYNSYMLIILAAFVGTSLLMAGVIDLKDWLAKRKSVKQKSKNPPIVTV
jgi:peptidoglycan/LPS O-acetylase OafA/YrhL